jgi:hypothetical protein
MWTWRILSNFATVDASAWYCVKQRKPQAQKSYIAVADHSLADPHGDVTFIAQLTNAHYFRRHHDHSFCKN